MPRDERKHQKALMKKRSKQKAATRHDFGSVSKEAILRRSHDFPLLECLINADWQDKNSSGLVQIIVARQQPDGNVCYGTYLIDQYLLGLKNTFADAGVSRRRYEEDVRNKISARTPMKACPLELAHQMIYAAIEYAAQYGFEPEKDFVVSKFLLAPRGTLEEPYHLTFGKNGKPFFVAGPHDNSARILRQLEKTAGPGNYDFFAPLSDF